MTLVYSDKNMCLVDHQDYISKIYKSTSVQTETTNFTQSFVLLEVLFCIRNKKEGVSKKRKHKSEQVIEEAFMVQSMYNEFIKQLPNDIKQSSCKYKMVDTIIVRKQAQQLFEMPTLCKGTGGNNSDTAITVKMDDNYLLPARSKFMTGCVKEMCHKLSENNHKYDIVIADPPWWNKYIRRLKNANIKMSYSMMYNEDIASIPVKALFSQNCLVAIWCTNAESNIAAVKNVIFPKWGVEYVTTWYWLKLSVDFEPMCSFGSGCKKQPYERLIIGRVGEVKDVPTNKVFASVPSALHSHKPPLLELLKPCVVPDRPLILELFARYLLPDTTSVGYEPLKWQKLAVYNEASQAQNHNNTGDKKLVQTITPLRKEMSFESNR